MIIMLVGPRQYHWWHTLRQHLAIGQKSQPKMDDLQTFTNYKKCFPNYKK
jgi:hypothetical protein